jgi:hypothetical protein
MLRLPSPHPGIPYDIYYDLSHEEGKLLFNVKPQIQRFIHHDECFYVAVGKLEVFSFTSPLLNSITMMAIKAPDSSLYFSKGSAVQRLLKYEPFYNNHVLMVNSRQIHGRFMCKCACPSIVRAVHRENISFSSF